MTESASETGQLPPASTDTSAVAEADHPVSLVGTIETLVAQLRSGMDAGAQLGRAELALFRVGIVRMVLLSMVIVLIAISTWLVVLAAAWAALIELTHSQPLSFLILLVTLAAIAALMFYRIRTWYNVAFFPRIRRLLATALEQWNQESKT